MDGLVDIASNIIEKKARRAKSKIIKAIPENMRNSSFATISSLLNYSILNHNDINGYVKKKNINSEGFYGYLMKFKSWILENF